MPQLSPLNWIFLSMLFWLSFMSVSILIWWSSKTHFTTNMSNKSMMPKNKWIWR
uniref:ATP synthase F0 subunit 8 n=1 Tax=Eubela sp. MNHN IM 2013-9671 TaxID=2259822 RepID=A0A344H1Z8_9CAEN|nr:ATP synthase F0 subunit 8 [Eubela sp. MNHN IM 2013-9671]